MRPGRALRRRLAGHLTPPPKPAVAEQAFRYLFDGTAKAADFFSKWLMAGGGTFKIVGRSLIAQPGNTGIGLLYYAAEQFDNFTLRLDFALPHPRGNSNDNPGGLVRFHDPPQPGLPGPPAPSIPGH